MMGVGDDQAGVRQPAHWELLPGHLHGVPQRHLLGLVDPQILQEAEDPLVAAPVLRELVQPARSCSSWDSFSVRSTGAPAPPAAVESLRAAKTGPGGSWRAGRCRPTARRRAA